MTISTGRRLLSAVSFSACAFALACSGSESDPGADPPGPSAGGTSGGAVGAPPGSSGSGGTSPAAGGGGAPATGASGGAPSEGGSVAAGSPGAGGSATDGGSAGAPSGVGGGGTGNVGNAPSCADPTPRGSLDVPNVGTAPGGVTEADLKEGGATVVHYFQSVPGGLPPAETTDPAKQVGLFLTFNEHGGTGKDEIASVTKSLANLKRSGDFVVLGMAMEAGSHGYTTTGDHDRAKKLIAFALKNWPINPRRVYLWGRGEGATMSHQFGTENKASIAAMVTYSWGSERWPSNAANDQPDLYLVIGLDDYPDSHVPLVRRVYKAAVKAQINVIYREVPKLKGPTGNAPTNDDAVAWAISSRHKTQALASAEEALIAPYKDATAAQRICPDGALFANLSLVGGTQTGKYMPNVLHAGTEASRILAAQVSGRSNFGTEADTALGSLLADPSASVRKEALAALGNAANWRNAAAQKALIDFASSATQSPAERGLAIDAIGVAVKFQIGGAVDTGGYQDVPLFQALVKLLSDADASVRTKAFGVLKPAMSSNYDPAAAPTSQQSAITAWQNWVLTLKG